MLAVDHHSNHIPAFFIGLTGGLLLFLIPLGRQVVIQIHIDRTTYHKDHGNLTVGILDAVDLVANLDGGFGNGNCRTLGYIINNAILCHSTGNGVCRNRVAGYCGNHLPASKSAAGAALYAVILIHSLDHIAVELQCHSHIGIQQVCQSLVSRFDLDNLFAVKELEVVITIFCRSALGCLLCGVVVSVQNPVDRSIYLTAYHKYIGNIAAEITEAIELITHLNGGEFALLGSRAADIVDFSILVGHSNKFFAVLGCLYRAVCTDLGNHAIVKHRYITARNRARSVCCCNHISTELQTQNLAASCVNSMNDVFVHGL